jgi:BirA family biotin operon repressor/biotin-[acetyl-CoA-carboxylase] ligase
MQYTLAVVSSCLGPRPYRYFERIRSTMDAAREWLTEGAPHGGLVITGEQTAGRGRMGRSWLIPDGCALAMSVILRPANGTALPQVSMLGGLAVLDALASLGLGGLFLKWPNDILIGDKKVCGVLVETAWDGVYLRGAILGIGLNVSGEFDKPEIAAIATTIAEALGRPADAAQVLRAVIQSLEARLADLDTPIMFDAWRARLGTIGQRVRVEGSSAFEGVAEDVNTMGALLVRADDGQLRTVLAGDVRVRPAQT